MGGVPWGSGCFLKQPHRTMALPSMQAHARRRMIGMRSQCLGVRGSRMRFLVVVVDNAARSDQAWLAPRIFLLRGQPFMLMQQDILFFLVHTCSVYSLQADGVFHQDGDSGQLMTSMSWSITPFDN